MLRDYNLLHQQGQNAMQQLSTANCSLTGFDAPICINFCQKTFNYAFAQ